MRCKQCNTPLKSSEIIYYPEQQRFEDWCKKCRDRYYSEIPIEEIVEGLEDEQEH